MVHGSIGPQKHALRSASTQQLQAPPELWQSMATLQGVLRSHPHASPTGHLHVTEVIVPVHLHPTPPWQFGFATCMHVTPDSVRETSPQSPDGHESILVQNFLARLLASFLSACFASSLVQPSPTAAIEASCAPSQVTDPLAYAERAPMVLMTGKLHNSASPAPDFRSCRRVTVEDVASWSGSLSICCSPFRSSGQGSF